MVGALDDVEVVLDDHQGVTSFYQGIEGMEQTLDVVEVEARGRLVEDEERGLLFLLADEVGELHALVLTAREGAGTLAELDVTESHLLQGAQTFHDDAAVVEVGVQARVLLVAEEVDCLVDGHVEHVVDVLSAVAYLEDVVLEALAVARLAWQHEVCHELHLDGDVAGSLALLAPSALGVEGEEL